MRAQRCAASLHVLRGMNVGMLRRCIARAAALIGEKEKKRQAFLILYPHLPCPDR